LLAVVARNGVEGFLGFPANVGICRAVLAVREGPDDAECRGVEVVVRVVGVVAGNEPELSDRDRLSGCLKLADLGQVLVVGGGQLAIRCTSRRT
jgi:hypothetical protein